MSVPAYKRQKPDPNNPRDPEFVLLSKKLYVEVIDLLSCMSARYGRLIAVPTAELAGEVQDYAVKANDVFPSDGQKLALRREYLLRCHAAAKALGERMDKVHEVLRSNPEGAFRNGKGITLNAEAALKKLHRMETDVGADCVALGLRVNRRKCRYAPLQRPFRYCKTKFRLTETGRVVTHRTGDAQRRCRRKMRLLAARGDWEGVRAQIVSAKGYYKRHNDNGRLTALRTLHSALRKERAA